MRRALIATLLCAGILGLQANAQQPNAVPPGARPAGDTSKPPAAPKKPSVADRTKGNKKIDGLFTLYQDTTTGSVQMYIRKDQLNKEFI